MSHLDNGRILVTGGAGMIGSAVIWALNRRGITNILVTDALGTDERWRNLVPLQFADYMESDDFMEKLKSKPALFSDIKCVFHLGACSATTETDARYLAQNNYAYTRDLCAWALGNNTRFLYASSAATYGDGANGYDDEHEADTLSKLRPLNMYGYSKHMFDLHALRGGFLDQIIGLKYFNVFGPNEYHKGDMRSVVHKAFGQIKKDGCMSLFKSYRKDYKDGEQMRDFLYVKDAVDITLFLAESPSAGGLYNVGSGEAHTWNELAAALFTAMDKKPDIKYIAMPKPLRPKYQYFTQADISKLRNTGYKTVMPTLTQTVTDYVQNYLLPGKHLGD